jgi:uncharacterized membrane protein YoaK (UPF0700 family)
MFSKPPSNSPEIVWVGLILTAIAGFVDAIGYLNLREIYVSNMSGNTVAVAIHFSRHDWSNAWAHACPLLAFFPGLIAGDCIVEITKRSKKPSALMPALLVEAAGLLLFVLLEKYYLPHLGSLHRYVEPGYETAVGILAFSMGLQNGALRCIGALKDVHTYVTGTLLAAAHGFTAYLFWVTRYLRRSPKSRLRRVLKCTPHLASVRMAVLAGSLWLVYIVAAILGAISQATEGVHMMLIPVTLLILIATVDLVRPIRSRTQVRAGSPTQD